MNRHSKSHREQYSLWKWFISQHCWFAINKYFSISFSFSPFRCSCSRKSHSRNVEIFEKLEKPTFLSLAEIIIIIRKLSSIVVEIVVWLQPISTIQPIQLRGSFIQFDKCEKSHFSFIHFFSRISPIVANKQISNLFSHFSFSTILKSKRRRKKMWEC